MKVRHIKPPEWVDTEETGVIQPSHVAGLVHEIELEPGDLLQGEKGDPGEKGDKGEKGDPGEPGLPGAAGGGVAGMVAHFARPTAPVGWLVCDGAAVSRATYAALFEAIGVTFGAGDGSTTFKLPDLRGVFVRGLDSGRGYDTGRAFGSEQNSENKLHNHTGVANAGGKHSLGQFYARADAAAGSSPRMVVSGTGLDQGGEFWGEHQHSITLGNAGGTESRPRNVALLPCICTGA